MINDHKKDRPCLKIIKRYFISVRMFLYHNLQNDIKDWFLIHLQSIQFLIQQN